MKTTILNYFFVGLAIFGLASCSKKEEQQVQPERIGHRQYNLAYGKDSANKMDLYVPSTQSESALPFAILVHGGGWIAGDKTDMHGFQDQLMSMGIASVSINYRYANRTNVHYKEMMEDMANAIGYVNDHAVAWNVKHSKFVLVGASAGAHMSLLYAYKFDVTDNIAAVVSLAGPTDFTDLQWLFYSGLKSGLIPAIQMVTADTIPANGHLPYSYTVVSPLLEVRNKPTLIIHGMADSVIDYQQAYNLHEQMQQKKFVSRLVSIPNAGHNLGMDEANTTAMVFNEIANWVNIYSK